MLEIICAFLQYDKWECLRVYDVIFPSRCVLAFKKLYSDSKVLQLSINITKLMEVKPQIHDVGYDLCISII